MNVKSHGLGSREMIIIDEVYDDLVSKIYRGIMDLSQNQTIYLNLQDDWDQSLAELTASGNKAVSC